MAIKIEMLRCFATVARSGNLSDAAERLGRTPSAVSMMLKQFEEHLGAPLFESERKSRLTALGRFALQEASRELDHFERTVGSIQSYARSEAGFMRLAAVPSVAATILPVALQRFMAEHPGVWIDMRDMDSATVLREIERERIDIGLATGTNAASGIARIELFSDDFGLVCPADHALAQDNGPLLWRDIAQWPIIANGLCAQIADEDFQKAIAGAQLMVRNTTSLLALVRAGVGVTVLPRLAVDASDPEIVFRPVVDDDAQRPIDILYAAHNQLSPAASRFVEVVRQTSREIVAGWG
jgi:DNA-binding transcriptional LysR family regulator